MKQTWKRIAIVALVVLNGVLLAGLVHLNMEPAHAQSFRPTNYTLAVGSIGTDYEVVYITNLQNKRMIALRWDKTSERVVPFGPRNLEQDSGSR
jgi:hypothetical protein